MCLTETATVLATGDGRALVRLAGRDLVLVNLLVPDARPGDEVLTGMGHVLGRATGDRDARPAAARSTGTAAPGEAAP
jgi:hypothetical protein